MSKKLNLVAGWIAVACLSVRNVVYAAGEGDPLGSSSSTGLTESNRGTLEKIADPVPDLGTRVQELESRISDLGDASRLDALKEGLFPFGTDVTWILICVALALSMLGLLLGVQALLKITSLQNHLSKPEKTPNKRQSLEQDERLKELEVQLDNLQKSFDVMEDKTNSASYQQQPAPRRISKSEPRPSPMPVVATQHSTMKPTTIEDEYRDFVEAYNALQRMTDLDIMTKKKKREEFASRFAIRAFNCTNYQQRMNNTSLPLEFADETPVKANFWAFRLSNQTYAVVPNVKTYEDSVHEAGGMGKIFDSNYNTGKSYHNIIVERPAIFGAGWVFQDRGKGKIKLS